MLRIAIDIDSRFSAPAIEALHEVGVEFAESSSGAIARSNRFPAEVFFMPYSEIMQNVAVGTLDLGVVGEHHIAENHLVTIEILRSFGSVRSNLSLAVPKSTIYKGIEWFSGKKIATPYPEILGKFLKAKNVHTKIVTVSNLTSFVPEAGIADAVFDLVNTGTTLLQHNLREVEVVMQTRPVLIASNGLQSGTHMIVDELLRRIDAQQAALGKKLIRMRIKIERQQEITAALGSDAEPTIVPLAHQGLCILSVVMDENHLWDVLTRLKQLEATDICICPIEKLIL